MQWSHHDHCKAGDPASLPPPPRSLDLVNHWLWRSRAGARATWATSPAAVEFGQIFVSDSAD